MTSEIELRKWLHRADKTHMENIQFGMKVWNSIEFNLLTKHEIITEECCKLIEKVSTELETSADIDAAWIVINEFLGLKCSPGAVGSSVKTTLTKTLVAVLNGVKCRRFIVYKGLVTLLQNSSMQSFFKSNSKAFAMLAGASVDYLVKILESNEESGFERSDALVREVVQLTKNYIKQTPFLNEFRKPFVKHLLIPISELFISLRKDGTISESDFFNILHEIYFADNESENPFNQLLLQPENKDFAFLLNVPVHVFMLIVEGVFQPLKVETSTQGHFIQFLFNVYFKQSNQKFASEQQMLLVLSLFLSALKSYDVPLNFDIVGVKATEYIGKNIESLNITESNLYEILSVLCASIELNPMMLEHSIISLVVRCMLHRKDDRTTTMFERFLNLVIDMYRRLSRSEKFISNLMRTMWQKLSELKLSKKLKRKLGTVDLNGSVVESPKRLKLDSVGNVDVSIINGSVCDEENRDHKFLLLLAEHLCSNDARPIASTHLSDEWKNIQFAWPNRVGESFSKFISGLVSKPSMVVWKTLIFTLNDYVKLIRDGDLSENSLFLIDWTSALLCQYFHGCRLAEQSDKTWESIDNNRKLQHTLLKDFGSAILSQEHNIRTMNAFLTLCFASGNFDLLRWFYCPDSITSDQIERSIADNTNNFVHSYLQPTEWVLIEQRISNFGKHECRSNLNRLYMQKLKSKLVIKRNETLNVAGNQSNEPVDISNHLLPSTLSGNEDLSELADILMDETTNQWFIDQLTRSQKIQVARNVVELDCDATGNVRLTELLVGNVADQEFFDFLAVAVFEKIGLEAVNDIVIFKRVNFDDVFAGDDSFCKELFRGMKKSSIAVPNSEEPSNLQRICRLLDILPIGFVSLNVKNILLHLSLGLLRYSAGENVHIWCKYVKKLLLLGDAPDVFRYLKVKQLPGIFDNCDGDLDVLYKLIFEKKLNDLAPSTAKIVSDLLQLIQAETYESVGGCSYMDIGVRLLEFFNKNKKCKDLGSQYRDVVLVKIREFFGEEMSHAKDDEQTFVAKTASGFIHIISTMNEFDDQLKRIVKIYVDNMQNCYDSHSIKLLNIIVSNKVSLGYTDTDIASIIDKFWNELTRDLGEAKDPNIYQPFVKFVFSLKSSEELIDMLTALNAKNVADEDALKRFDIFEKLFRLIFKCQLNKTKGGIFSEFFRQVSFQIVIKLRNFDASTQHIVRQKLLDCQKHLCINIQIPVTFDLIDDILGFMSETIKQQQIKTVTDVTILKETHTRISDLCYGLIQHRHYFIIDRIPQFVVILKDLMQSVCWFKCNRVRGKQLDDEEVTALAELSHKMENIVKAFVKHAKEVKRIAPYFLLFIINLMISKEHVSTMYPKIKTHFDYICYDIISVCDHRVEGFIMRNCNEASKQQYETMVKEYRKYHKFKGKV